jgi:predicted RNase H-like HicB family nuclease
MIDVSSRDAVDNRRLFFYFSTMRQYDYIAWKDEGQWTVHSPSIPGVWGIGRTRRAAEKDFHQALELLLLHLKEIGEPPPRARKIVTGTIEVA